MKTTDEELYNTRLLLLSEMTNVWSLARALLEHERASTAPTDQPFSEREILTLCLVEQFEGLMTATALSKVFGLHHSQVGKILDKLVGRELLKKSTEHISKKSGRGMPLHLNPKGSQALREIKLGLGRRFSYLNQELNADQLKQAHELIKKMNAMAKRTFEERVFAKLPTLTF